jgi:hypothetical protein
MSSRSLTEHYSTCEERLWAEGEERRNTPASKSKKVTETLTLPSEATTTTTTTTTTITLHYYTTLHYITLHYYYYTTLHYTTLLLLHYTTLHYITTTTLLCSRTTALGGVDRAGSGGLIAGRDVAMGRVGPTRGLGGFGTRSTLQIHLFAGRRRLPDGALFRC